MDETALAAVDVLTPIGSALSYPYIHMREFERVGAALLYWDSVRRIVPPSARVSNRAEGDDDNARLLADEGLLVATDPTPYEAAAADKFFAHITPRAAEFTITPEQARDFANQERGIHIEKLGDSVLARIQGLQLGHACGEWVGMHDEVGSLYMYYLASEMSRNIQAPLLAPTDEEAAFGKTLLFEPEPGADVSADLLRLGVSLPSPKDFQQGGISVQDLVDFAKKRAGERIAFREAIQEIITVARNTADPNALDDYIRREARVIGEAVSNLRKTIDELHVGAAKSAAAITLPAGLASALAVAPLSPVAAAILAATGVVISVVACFAETRGKLRTARISSPYHYVLSVESELPGLR